MGTTVADCDPQGCPFQATLDLIGRKHTLTVLWALRSAGPHRFNEIKAAAQVNQVTLSQRLSELQAAGLVAREAFAEIPPRVEYRLTAMGEDLMPLMDALDAWAERYPDVARHTAPA